MQTHIIQHLLITDLAVSGLLGLLHPRPSLCKAACRLSQKWLGWGGGEMFGLRRGTSLLHMVPHKAKLSLCTAHMIKTVQLTGRNGTRFTPDPFLYGT
jgi:hypothetical protein